MLIIIIAAAILIIGILLNQMGKCKGSIGTFLSIVCGTGVLFGCICAVLIQQIPAEHNYQKTLYEKEVIEYRIENQDSNIVGNELLYSDIVEFNNKIRDAKRYVGNPWTNWFGNAKIASIDYIEIPGLE